MNKVNIWAAYAFACVLVLSLAGCKSANEVIGYGAMGVTTAAELITRECGNTVPGGDCLTTSKITTTEKNEMKIRLQQTQVYLSESARYARMGDNGSSQTALEHADAILAAIEAILIQRGIE